MIHPVGLENLNNIICGIYIPHASLNNTSSSPNESKNLDYEIDLDTCGEDTRTIVIIRNIPHE